MDPKFTGRILEEIKLCRGKTITTSLCSGCSKNYKLIGSDRYDIDSNDDKYTVKGCKSFTALTRTRKKVASTNNYRKASLKN